MAGFLLDTNVISEIRRVRPHQGVLNWISSLTEDEIFIPAVVVGEVQSGVEKARRTDRAKAAEIERWLEDLIATVNVVAMDANMFRDCARLLHGNSRAAYEDAMIAATARIRSLTIATRNIADFRSFDVAVFNPFDYRG